MIFLRRICSSRPGDGEQRRQSLAALTARGRGLYCFQPQPRQPVLRRNKLRIFRFRASTKAQPLRLFLLSPQSGHFVGAQLWPDVVCPSRLGGMMQPAKAAHGAFLARRKLAAFGSSRAPCAFSQPAVLSALLVIQLFGIVIPPPYFLLRAPKGALRPFSVAVLLYYFSWCASEYSVVDRISCYVSHDNV